MVSFCKQLFNFPLQATYLLLLYLQHFLVSEYVGLQSHYFLFVLILHFVPLFYQCFVLFILAFLQLRAPILFPLQRLQLELLRLHL